MWNMTVAQVKLASYDFSHVEYLKDNKDKGKEDENKNFKTIVLKDANSVDLLNNLGRPIVNRKKLKKK